MQLPKRLQSIDVFRAVTMFFMIFVNDVDGVEKIPEWIKHVKANVDGLGFADTIFPAFLFIVGLSIPFAFQKRIQNNEDTKGVALHIVFRSLALIIIGVFHVNLESYSSAALLPQPAWEILITVGFFLIWLDYPSTIKTTTKYILQAVGIIILIVMAALYKGEHEGTITWMHTEWWGILGLIGWGYFTCAMIYILSKGKFIIQIAAFIFFLVYGIFSHATEHSFLERLDNPLIIGTGAMPALIMGGVIISLLYRRLINQNKNIFMPYFIVGAAMIVFAFLIRPFGGISKIHATPSWVCLCIGISTLVFELIIVLVDAKGKSNWFNIIKPAGTSTLTCYLIPYILYSLLELLNINFPQPLNEGIGGIIRSFAIAFIIIFITGFLEKRKIRLKI